MKVARVWWGALALASVVGLVAVGVAGAAATAVPLGGAQSFSVLAGAGITNTGPTRISGDLGTFPTTSVAGTASLTVGGTNHGGDAVTQRAKTDLVAAYTTAAGEGPTSPIAGDLVGRVLVAGVYNSASSIGLSGAVTLNGEGNPNAVFVFQAGSSLTTASGSRIILINGAQACNVFWKVGSSATLGTGSAFVGNVIALTSITVTTGATVDGRVLARNGAVTLDTDTITTSTCTKPPVATTPAKSTPSSSPSEQQKKLAAAKAAAVKLAATKAAKTRAAAVKRLTIEVTPPKQAQHAYGFTG
jgi:Ice-binding-like